jgi:spermidine/putrescine-binding protein
VKKVLAGILPEVSIAKNFLSPVGALTDGEPSQLIVVSHGETAFPPLSDAKWKFFLPEDGASLWVLTLVLHRKVADLDMASRFIDYLLEEDQAIRLAKATHQASANRSLEATTQIDARLKPSYLRQVPLDRVKVWRDFSRAREIREMLPR